MKNPPKFVIIDDNMIVCDISSNKIFIKDSKLFYDKLDYKTAIYQLMENEDDSKGSHFPIDKGSREG